MGTKEEIAMEFRASVAKVMLSMSEMERDGKKHSEAWAFVTQTAIDCLAHLIVYGTQGNEEKTRNAAKMATLHLEDAIVEKKAQWAIMKKQIEDAKGKSG